MRSQPLLLDRSAYPSALTERPAWHDRLWRWRTMAERAMPADLVIVLAPESGDDANFLQCIEDIPIEQFVAEPGIERFDVTVLPRDCQAR